MEAQIIILPALKEHEQAVYGLMCELEGAKLHRQFFADVYAKNLQNKDIRYFAALRDGKVIGFSSLHMQLLLHHAALIGEIQEIVVSESCRGQGIGQRLFHEMKTAALAYGCAQMEVCCRKERTLSHRFYQKMGMVLSHDKLCMKLAEGE